MTDSRKAGQDWDRSASAVVRDIIHGWDPYGLLDLGAPDDEFDSEIAAVVAQIPSIRSENDAVDAVSEVFSSAFDPELFGKENCRSVGSELYRTLADKNLLDPQQETLVERNRIMKAVLAVVAGIVVGGVVNMGLIITGGLMISPPEGVDSSDIESIKANIHLYEVRHFIVPWLAHGLGTLVGAALAASLAQNHKMRFALAIGVVFLLGGIMMAFELPAPTWVEAVDLVGCYIPMAWIGGMIVTQRNPG